MSADSDSESDAIEGTEGRTGGRVGGVVPNSKSPEPTESEGSPTVLILLLLATLLAGRNALGGDEGSMVYSVSSYSSSTTIVRDADGTSEPRYETQTQSSFSTNVPGLAEKMAEKGGGAPADVVGSLLFPSF